MKKILAGIDSAQKTFKAGYVGVEGAVKNIKEIYIYYSSDCVTWTEVKTSVTTTYVQDVAVINDSLYILYYTSSTPIYKYLITSDFVNFTTYTYTSYKYSITKEFIFFSIYSNIVTKYTSSTNSDNTTYYLNLRKSTDGGTTWTDITSPGYVDLE